MSQPKLVGILIVLLLVLIAAYLLMPSNHSSPKAPTNETQGAFPLANPAMPTASNGEPAPGTTSVNVYYYDAARDTENDNVLCSARGLVAVPRAIAATEAPLRAALERLLAGEPAGEGLEAFPTGVILESVSVTNGVATIRLSDPDNRTSGGSCRASVLRAQLEATARQFPSVTSVRVEPDTLFQP